jgi:hypothetical protein
LKPIFAKSGQKDSNSFLEVNAFRINCPELMKAPLARVHGLLTQMRRKTLKRNENNPKKKWWTLCSAATPKGSTRTPLRPSFSF